MASNPIPTCPKCKQADQVQKVSNVYDANTEEWSEEKLGMDVFGHIEDQKVKHEAHTKLGLRLKPPEEPTAPRSPALWYIIGIIIAVIILAGLCPFAVAPFAIVIPIVMVNSETLPAVLQGQNGRMLMVGIGAAVLIGGLVVLGLLVWAGFAISGGTAGTWRPTGIRKKRMSGMNCSHSSGLKNAGSSCISASGIWWFSYRRKTRRSRWRIWGSISGMLITSFREGRGEGRDVGVRQKNRPTLSPPQTPRFSAYARHLGRVSHKVR